MKSVNIMNFVRYIDERIENSVRKLYEMTAQELELVNEFGLENTFLLQYDAVIDSNYQKLFKEKATDKTEVGLWYEIVEPLTSACGLPYRSEYGWKWDWHIIPGFSMAYTPHERELLADEAMRKFKEVYGCYPKTVASWLIDTHTINYLAENYDISAFAICRDQVSTDAYTLMGGYFNQAYYPSKNNMFTPAQTDEMSVNVPMFRLLGSCPIHNYEGSKYLSEKVANGNVYTLEPAWTVGGTPEYVDSLFKTYFENESLAFAYAQLGQENSFGSECLPALRMQLEKIIKVKDVHIQKMCDTGEAFKKLFPGKTPATSVVALENWDSEDIQAAYYDCQRYTSNIMRYENRIFIRSLFLFDENIKDKYIQDTCTTFDAVYENLPVIDTLNYSKGEKFNCGLVIDTNASAFDAVKVGDGALKIYWKDKSVVFDEEKITIVSEKMCFYTGSMQVRVSGNQILYSYKGTEYVLRVKNADVMLLEYEDVEIVPENGVCELWPLSIGL